MCGQEAAQRYFICRKSYRCSSNDALRQWKGTILSFMTVTDGITHARPSAALLVCFSLGLTLMVGCSSEPTPEELTAIALSSGDITDREEAASQLTIMGESALPFMIEILDKSDSPSIRSLAVSGIAATYSYDQVDRLIDLIGDPAPAVQQSAFRAVCRLLGTEFNPIPVDATPEERQKEIGKIRKVYKNMLDSGMLQDWIERLKRKKASA